MDTSERSMTGGLLSGRVKPRDTKHIDPRSFSDWTIANIFAVAEACRRVGATPTTGRIVKVLEMSGEPTTGVAELIDQMRAEG